MFAILYINKTVYMETLELYIDMYSYLLWFQGTVGKSLIDTLSAYFLAMQVCRSFSASVPVCLHT
jgi:hypothetical protein